MSTANTQWNPINENLENNENREKDIAYEAKKWEKLDMKWGQEAMWGVWAIWPEAGKEIAKKALTLEEQEAEQENPDDLLTQLDGWEWKEKKEKTHSLKWSDDFKDEIIDTINQSADYSLEIWTWIDWVKDDEKLWDTNEIPKDFASSCEYAPLIKMFMEQGKLTHEEWLELWEKWLNAENFHQVIKEVWLDSEQSKNLINCLNYVSSDKTTIEATQEVQKYFEWIFWEFKNPEAQVSSFASEAYNEVISHYIPHSETPKERDQNLTLAIQMAAWDIVNKWVLNLSPWNTETYNAALLTIQNDDSQVEARFVALTKISEIVWSDQATKGGWKKNADALRNKQKSALQAKEQSTSFLKTQTDKINTDQLNTKIPEDNENKEAKTLEASWDVFTAWTLDLASDNTSEWSEATS